MSTNKLKIGIKRLEAKIEGLKVARQYLEAELESLKKLDNEKGEK